jgi:hypothetical protein
MTLQPFTSNFADNSTEAGFQFTFYCDICREGYKTKFVESNSHKKGRFFKNLGKLASAAVQISGKYGVGYGLEKGADVIGERFRGMSPEWHKEHEAAFELAQNEAKGHFHRCPRCKKYVCDNDWNEQEGLCVNDAPRVNVEVAAAKAQKAVDDIRAKAASTQIFTGEIESKQTICPQCGKPAGEGKFCGNCGADLSLAKCPKCGAQNAVGTNFCGECGTKLG